MKLRNKKTGDIYELNELCLYDDKGFAKRPFLKSLSELNAEWEDYEEPEEYWYIYADKARREECGDFLEENFKAVGNYFETKEEAEKAVGKLKAYKRLKDKGFRFERWLLGGEYGNTITFSDYIEYNDETRADLNLLFGGEE